ncbi:MAG: SDR family oxidoreductase [Thermaceae bacterium]|nr:SDR family oxidoreductase [Thermaceae bacterium]
MKLVVFGASRGVGRQVVEQALGAGQSVTAFVRSADALSSRPHLAIVQGDALDSDSVFRAVQGQDAVIVALGSGNDNGGDVRSQGTANIVQAMQKLMVKHLVVVSSFGVGDSHKGPIAAMAWLFLRKALEEHERQEKVVMGSGLDWTIVRPTGLTNDPKTGKYQVGKSGGGRISRADVADFILKALGDSSYLGKAVVVSY